MNSKCCVQLFGFTSVPVPMILMMVFEVEAYLEENFEFRRNVVSGKTEYRAINCEE